MSLYTSSQNFHYSFNYNPSQMSLAGMDLGPKMDWTLDNVLHQRFKVFKERCIDILSGPLHLSHLKKTRYIIFITGQEKKVQSSFLSGQQKIKSPMMVQRQCQKRTSEHIGNSLRPI